jgi:hypothetical protein
MGAAPYLYGGHKWGKSGHRFFHIKRELKKASV